MRTRVQQRVNELTGTYYSTAEINSALNEAQRLFVLLTLCLEVTAAFTLTAAVTFYHMRTTFEDWILPLRVTTLGGSKIFPSELEDLDSLDSGWQASPGAPVRYASLGFDFFAIYQQPAAAGTVVNITYAQQPLVMAADTDTPQIQQEFHPALVAYAIYRVRMKEGAQEFAKTMPYFNSFLDEAQKCGEYVRARNIGGGYDILPFELARFDRSKVARASATKRPEGANKQA
jgi:hypothetical protein